MEYLERTSVEITHQVVIGGVGVIVWVGFGDSHSDTVGKDGEEDEYIERPAGLESRTE